MVGKIKGPNAGLAAVTSAGNIAKIAATKFKSSSISTSSPTSTPSVPSIPSGTGTGTGDFTPSQFFGLGQTSPIGQQAPPQQVYVTEGDISGVQRRVAVTENRVAFG